LAEDQNRLRKLGITSSLSKPVKQSELFDLIISVIGEPEGHAAQARTAAGGRRAVKRALGLRILVAEDNEVNQLVAKRIFERLGHRVTVVENGQEAISALQRRKFDLIAMDVQMPVMDGLDSTVAIRKSEEKTGGHMPIVAMTAHAMKGDRERCLAAGMDGYVAKPIRSSELEKTLSEVLGKTSRNAKVKYLADGRDGSVIDTAALLEGVGGNRRLLQKLAKLFLTDLPRLVARIRASSKARDGEELAKTAHALKGAIGNFGAAKAVSAAAELERLARVGEFSAVENAWTTLELELSLAKNNLEKLAAPARREPAKAGERKRRRRRPAGLTKKEIS
jgi:CheY-like chemotaxis protein